MFEAAELSTPSCDVRLCYARPYPCSFHVQMIFDDFLCGSGLSTYPITLNVIQYARYCFCDCDPRPSSLSAVACLVKRVDPYALKAVHYIYY